MLISPIVMVVLIIHHMNNKTDCFNQFVFKRVVWHLHSGNKVLQNQLLLWSIVIINGNISKNTSYIGWATVITSCGKLSWQPQLGKSLSEWHIRENGLIFFFFLVFNQFHWHHCIFTRRSRCKHWLVECQLSFFFTPKKLCNTASFRTSLSCTK